LNATGDCLACLMRVGFERSPPDLISPVFGDFEITRREDGSWWELGRGAMGVTYRANDKILNRSVALKVIDVPETAGDGQMVRDRFLREARAAAAFKHTNVAGVFHFGASPGGEGCYYAMELVEGETLEALVRRDGPLKVEVALEIAVQVTRALIAAAAHAMMHRDLKPGNIMLTHRDGVAELEVKVIDFGLAKAIADTGIERDLTQGAFVGTPAFASPEQFCGAPADARSDIYSLGVTLWYALTGEVPYAGRTIEEIRHGQAEVALPVEELIARNIPTPVMQLLSLTLALNPHHRPGSARELMEGLESCRAQLRGSSPDGSSARQIGLRITALVVVPAIAAATFFALRMQQPTTTAPLGVPAKSIAVLPFENLSSDRENGYFTEGVQDEILTHLARIADLKVISRTSVAHYKTGAQRNLREIGQQLSVAHLLEGSVQRSGNKVRVIAQLIDSRNDAHLWAQTYDRDLADVFAIQSEIATSIARELQASLSAREKAAIERAPTNDVAAFELYARAEVLLTRNAKGNLMEAADLLNRAVARDPAFFNAYCLLATSHDQLYFLGYDHTPARLALAERAIEAAFRLRPDAGEAHLARAQNLYRGYLDYGAALAELEIAATTLPNNARVFELKGYIERLQGKPEEAMRSLERAVDLDPRRSDILQQIAISYRFLHRYAEQKSVLNRALAIDPNNVDIKLQLAAVDFYWKADSRPLHQMVDSIRAANPAATQDIAEYWLFYALAERDAAAARNAVLAAGDNPPFSDESVDFTRSFMEGVIARMTKDEAGARAAFIAARAEQQTILQAPESYGPALCVLGLIDARLGRKEEALQKARRAVELLPIEKDAIHGTGMVKYFAMIAAWAGEKDLACEQLALAVRPPSPLTYGHLKLLPQWDPLRGDPRFEKIVASLAPK
jgi:TolB-like protein/Flp pilus assembly protein TadD